MTCDEWAVQIHDWTSIVGANFFPVHDYAIYSAKVYGGRLARVFLRVSKVRR